MRYFLVLGLLVLFSLKAVSQTVTVTDMLTGEPLEQATLYSEKPHTMVTTNREGRAAIQSMKDSRRIEIRMLGYRTEARTWENLQCDSFKVMLYPVAFNLDVMVVSATRQMQSSREVPARIASLQADQVAMQNPQTAADLLAISGKVFIQKSQQGGGSPMIRGFATNRLLYTIDGVRMNTAIFRSGNIQNVISLDPLSIENTEVYFGPGSVIYGSDAIGGVMSFQTLTPLFSGDQKSVVMGRAFTRRSSANNEITAHYDVNVGWKKWSVLSSITTSSYGDLKMGSVGPEEYLRPFYVQRIDSLDVVVRNEDPRVQRPSGYEQMNIMQKVRFAPNQTWDFTYAFHFSETSPYSRYDRHIRYKNGLPRSAEWDYGPQKWMMHHLEASHNQGNNLYDLMTLRLAWQQFGESRIDRNFNHPLRRTRTEAVDALSLNLDFTKAIAGRHTLIYGLEGVYNDVQSTGDDTNIETGITVPGPSRYPQSQWSSWALYLTDRFRVSERFVLQGGIRYNHFFLDAAFDTTFYPFPFTQASLTDGALTGSVGMVYRPAERWVLSANLSSGFRSPNVDDMGKIFDSAPGIVVVPNPDLTAEYAWSGDVEVARVFGDFLKLDVSGYYTLLENVLVRRDFTLNGADSIMYAGEMSKVQAMQNGAVARVWGIQAGLEIKLPQGFRILSDFNYQLGEEELDDGSVSPSRHAAPWYGISRITWSQKQVKLELNAVYSGKKLYTQLPEEEKSKTEIYAIDDDGNPWSPGWYTLNFKASHQLGRNLTINAGLENITDRRYRPYSSGIVAPGRNLVISVMAKF
jgi:hemoglobin/transferrin/lactoferrin receptor protein